MSLSTRGTLITGSQVYIDKSPDGYWCTDQNTTMLITQDQANSNASIRPDLSVQGMLTWIFETDTPGTYRVESETPVKTNENSNTCDGGLETTNILFTIEAAPVEAITQQQTLGETDPAGLDCDKCGVHVTTTQDMATCYGEVVTGDLRSHIINKDRDAIISITVVAADSQYGDNTEQNSAIAPYMPLVYANGQYQDVSVSVATEPNVYTYDFGAGYQDNNKYHYDTEGTKTIYVKDKYGCIQTIYFEAALLPDIDPSEYPALFYISKGNSFRWVDRTNPDFDDCYNYKTDENTFDCELDDLDITYFYTQKFKRCVDIKTQFKSTYDTYQADMYDGETNALVANLPITTTQTNLEVTSSLSYLREDDDSFTYIYFSDGEVPWFYQVGGMLTVNTEPQQILGFIYIADLDVQAVQIQLLTVALGGFAEYTYNKQDYNVYEFPCPLTTTAVGVYYMKLTATKDGETVINQTPIFEVYDSISGYVDIFYYSDSNTDMYYGGDPQFSNQISIGLQSRAPAIQLELEIVNTAATNYLKKSFNMEKFTYVFEPLTLEIMRKLVYALANQKLFINSVGYATESVEIEVPNPETNMYVVTAVMFKANENMKFVDTGGTPFDWSSDVVLFDSGTVTFDRTTIPE